MKRFVVLVILAAAFGTPAWAATRTVTLSVPGMTCPTCPLAVKVALGRVEGVLDVEVTWEPKEAIVTYDDSMTEVAALTEATRDVGYPSSVKP